MRSRVLLFFFFSSRRRHTRSTRDWSSDVCSSDLNHVIRQTPAEQLGWRLPDNVVVPMAGGSLITKIYKAFNELMELGLVERKSVKFFGAQATGCSPISTAVKAGRNDIEPQKPNTIARSLAIGNPADGFYAAKTILASGGWAEDSSDPEIVDAIRLLAETEGIFTETAGGVTVGAARKLYAQGRIRPEETTVLCI